MTRRETASTSSTSSTLSTPRRVPFALLVGGLIVGSLALLLALNTASAANELKRHDLSEKDTAMAAQLQQLKIEVAASGAPANLASAAAALGMVPAGKPAFVVIGKDGKAKVMGRPGAATEPPLPVQPKPKPKSSKKAEPKKSASPSASTSKSASKSASKSSTSARDKKSSSSRDRKSRSRSTQPARPTSTPTPTLSLPGGAR